MSPVCRVIVFVYLIYGINLSTLASSKLTTSTTLMFTTVVYTNDLNSVTGFDLIWFGGVLGKGVLLSMYRVLRRGAGIGTI